MKALIFAAGKGTRLKPFTDNHPKALVEVNGTPLLERNIKYLQSYGINDFVINIYHFGEQIVEFLKKNNHFGAKIKISDEKEELLETGGGLVYALDKIDIDKPLLTLNGDVLWHDKNNFSDINFLSENFDINSHDFLLGLKKTQDYWGYDGGSQSIGDFDLIGKKLHHKTPQKEQKALMSHVYVGMQILNPKVLLGDHEKCFSVSKFYKSALNSDNILHRIEGIELTGKYFHIGTPQHLELANREF